MARCRRQDVNSSRCARCWSSPPSARSRSQDRHPHPGQGRDIILLRTDRLNVMPMNNAVGAVAPAGSRKPHRADRGQGDGSATVSWSVFILHRPLGTKRAIASMPAPTSRNTRIPKSQRMMGHDKSRAYSSDRHSLLLGRPRRPQERKPGKTRQSVRKPPSPRPPRAAKTGTVRKKPAKKAPVRRTSPKKARPTAKAPFKPTPARPPTPRSSHTDAEPARATHPAEGRIGVVTQDSHLSVVTLRLEPPGYIARWRCDPHPRTHHRFQPEGRFLLRLIMRPRPMISA